MFLQIKDVVYRTSTEKDFKSKLEQLTSEELKKIAVYVYEHGYYVRCVSEKRYSLEIIDIMTRKELISAILYMIWSSLSIYDDKHENIEAEYDDNGNFITYHYKKFSFII